MRHWKRLPSPETVIDMLRSGKDVGDVVKRYGGTPSRVTWIARKYGGVRNVRGGIVRTHSVAHVARMFSVDHMAPYLWVQHGYLRAKRGCHYPDRTDRRKRKLYLTDMDLLAFIEDRTTWMLWEPHQITDPWLQREAERVRQAADGCWLTVKEIAYRYQVAGTTVKSWIYRNEFPTTQRGHIHYIWSADLDGWIPPCERHQQEAAHATRKAD